MGCTVVLFRGLTGLLLRFQSRVIGVDMGRITFIFIIVGTVCPWYYWLSKWFRWTVTFWGFSKNQSHYGDYSTFFSPRKTPKVKSPECDLHCGDFSMTLCFETLRISNKWKSPCFSTKKANSRLLIEKRVCFLSLVSKKPIFFTRLWLLT